LDPPIIASSVKKLNLGHVPGLSSFHLLAQPSTFSNAIASSYPYHKLPSSCTTTTRHVLGDDGTSVSFPYAAFLALS
jgi:hypothetical protein